MKKAIISCVFGDAWEDIKKITFPRIEDYSKRHNYDFFCVKKLIEPGHYSKSIVGSLLKKGYSKVLFLDADILITKDCEDFETWGDGDFLALNEMYYYPPRKQNIESMFKEFSFNGEPKFYFNTGVFVANEKSLGAFCLPPIDIFPNDYGEQTWLNVMLHLWSIKTTNLNPIYNCMTSIGHQLGMKKFKEAKIIHYAGQSSNLNELYKKIKFDDKVLKSNSR